jgi:hypothetical protein
MEEIRDAFEGARARLGLKGADGSFDDMTKYSKSKGRLIRQKPDGRIVLYSKEDDRGTTLVEFESCEQSAVIGFLLDRLARGCALRDIWEVEKGRNLSNEEYSEEFDRLIGEYKKILLEIK